MRPLRCLAALLACAVLLAACDQDFLDQTNPNAPTTGSFWDSAEEAVQATNAVYEGMTYEGMYMRMGHALQDMPADDAIADSPWIFTAMGNFTLDATNPGPAWAWRDMYHGIYRANQVIKYVPEIDMDPELRERLVGEALFLRAFYYMHLVKMFNNVPLILGPAESPDDYIVPQAPPEDVWAQIVLDLQAAQEVLPESYAQDIGRVTWGAATAYLGKAFLFNERWSEAATEFKKIIDSGLYDLVDDPRDNFGIENENNVESIFEVQYSREVGGTENGWAGPPQVAWGETHARSITYAPIGYGWADVEASQGLLDTYLEEEAVDGGEDLRLRATLFFNAPGVTVYGTPFQDAYTGPNASKIFWRKYQNDQPGGNENDMRSGINIRVMRYADVLLMYAETQIMTGNLATAADYIQRVRTRANLPDRTAEFAALSQDALMDVLARERFLEFAGEGKRWDDIRRWGWLDDEEKRAMLCDNDSEFCAPLAQNSVDLYLPIPQGELDTNPLLEQNPGF